MNDSDIGFVILFLAVVLIGALITFCVKKRDGIKKTNDSISMNKFKVCIQLLSENWFKIILVIMLAYFGTRITKEIADLNLNTDCNCSCECSNEY